MFYKFVTIWKENQGIKLKVGHPTQPGPSQTQFNIIAVREEIYNLGQAHVSVCLGF